MIIKTVINIKGMHCRSCELIIEDKLKKIKGIKNVKANYHQSKADIFSERKINMDNVNQALVGLGYEQGKKDKKPFLSKDFNDYKALFYNLLILIVLYLILKNTGLFNLSTILSRKSSSLPTVFLIGITAGLSTCMTLVGGLVLSLSARHAEKHPEATTIEKFRPHLFFNLGRIILFFLFGGLIGLIGSTLQLSSAAVGIITIFVGIVMLFLGLQLTEISPRLGFLSFTLPPAISRFLGIKNYHQKEYSHKNAFVLGGLTFFLPCGFTQAMQVLAISSGSFWTGGLIMAVFAIGTTPGLLGIGGLTSILRGAWAKRFFKFVGLVVIILAVFNFANGFNLVKLNFRTNATNNKQTSKVDPNVTIENGIQIIKMKQSTRGYTSNHFTIKKGLPTKWIITSANADSCAASIILPKFNIYKYLTVGENIIEFMPNEVGSIKFSCAMGMYGGYFNVVEN